MTAEASSPKVPGAVLSMVSPVAPSGSADLHAQASLRCWGPPLLAG